MAGSSENQATQAFPNPPALFYKQYTDENVASGRAPPPPPPVKGSYHVFGAPFNTSDAMLRSLSEQGLKQLYPPHNDRKVELKTLNRSILICFLELLDLLIHNPSSPERNQKINNLSILFINMHHLINEYRPHQARETLKVVLERQKKQREDMILQIQHTIDKARSILKGCEVTLSQIVATLPAVEEKDSSAEEELNKMDTTEQGATAEHSAVDPTDRHLCEVVDQLLSNTVS